MYPPPEDKAKLDYKLRDWIDRAESEHNTFVAEMNTAEDYFDNLQTPTGFSEQHKTALTKANDASAIETRKSYVVINQIVQSHENIFGNFAHAKRVVNLFPRSPKDQKKIVPIRKTLEYIEDKNNSFVRVALPAIDHMLHTGLDWGKVWYDPFEDLPNGSIKEARVSARDVLVDYDSRDPYYEDTQFRIHRIRYLLADAKEEFRRISGFDADTLKPDMDWSQGISNQHNIQSLSRYCTVYEVQYRQMETVFKKIVGTRVEEITEEEYEKLEQDPEMKRYVVRDREDVYYTAYYNKTIQCFYNKKSKWQCFTLAPCINRRSENRVYPVGDFIYYQNLQDLFNVIMSLILDDAKQARKWLIGTDASTYATYGDVIQQAIDDGRNVIPVVSNATTLKPPEVSQGVLTLLQLVKQSIDGIRSLPAVSRGELPAKQISGETVNTLIASALTSHGRKDVMINYFLTELARIRYKIVTAMWDEHDWIRVTDARPGSPQFIPINMTIEGEENYTEFLAKQSQIDFPEQGQIDPQMAQEFKKFQKQFENENDVQISTQEKVQYDGKGEYFNDDEYVKHMQQVGMTPTEFVKKFNVERKPIKIYLINKLSSDTDIDVQYVVDFDVQKNKQQRQAVFMRLAEMGWITPVEAMNELEIESADDKYRNAQDANQANQIAERLKKDKNFQKAVSLAEDMASNKQLMDVVRAIKSKMDDEKIASAVGAEGDQNAS